MSTVNKKLHVASNLKGDEYSVNILDEQNHLFAQSCFNPYYDADEAEANAQLIVTSINNHYKLIEALDNLLIQLSPMFNFDFKTAPDYIQKAKELLQSIEQQTK